MFSMATVIRTDKPACHRVSGVRRWCLTAVLFCCALLAQGWCLDTPAFGQLGFQQQAQMQQWNTIRQQQNHAAERTLAAGQRASMRRLSGEQSPRQQRAWRGRGIWARSR